MPRGVQRARTDGNHTAVMDALRAAAMKPVSTASLGKGFPDIVVGFRGLNVALEVKDGEKAPSARALSADERDWHDTWPGQVAIVTSPEEAVMAVIQHCKSMGVL